MNSGWSLLVTFSASNKQESTPVEIINFLRGVYCLPIRHDTKEADSNTGTDLPRYS